MTTSTGASVKSIHIADRIHLVADLACSMSDACRFSGDPKWFWRLAEVAVDECLWGELPGSIAASQSIAHAI